jgi:hypothetical protein
MWRNLKLEKVHFRDVQEHLHAKPAPSSLSEEQGPPGETLIAWEKIAIIFSIA